MVQRENNRSLLPDKMGFPLERQERADPEFAPIAEANDQILALIDEACTLGCGNGKEPAQLGRGKKAHEAYNPYPASHKLKVSGKRRSTFAASGASTL
jgi:hypothetical protein